MPDAPAGLTFREALDARDLPRLRAMLAEQPQLASGTLEPSHGHPAGATPLAYIAMLRFDARRHGRASGLSGTGDVAQSLIDAGAPVDGPVGDRETPLMTAASYGDTEVARVLVRAGADLEAVASSDAGGVPGGTALEHAAVFGMTEIVDILVGAGARLTSVEMAAAAGDLSDWSLDDVSPQARIRALVFAADHERLSVIRELVAAGTPIDAVDSVWGRQAWAVAKENHRAASIECLLSLGADSAAFD